MRIAVSGTHFIGKSTLIQDFLNTHPEYRREVEVYDQLQEIGMEELSLEPSLDSLLAQLDASIQRLHSTADEKNIIFDRCPVDYIAYAMSLFDQDEIDIEDTEVAERFLDVKSALNTLDLIVFLPIAKENAIVYTEDNPAYRKRADKCFKKLFRDDVCDIFPRHNHPRIIEVTGDRLSRLKILEAYLQ